MRFLSHKEFEVGSQESFERVAQKQRTRQALLAATRELLAEGRQPTVAEAADRAQISRATAYRYFSAPDVMAQEAALDTIAREFEQVHFRGMTDAGDLSSRAEVVVTAILEMVIANEALFRTFLGTAGSGGPNPGRRGGRRLTWLREALAPLASVLPTERFERLLTGLALLTGIETIVVFADVCGIEAGDLTATARSIARLLVKGALAEDNKSR
jgi:AcrR family transcriptional regulator